MCMWICVCLCLAGAACRAGQASQAALAGVVALPYKMHPFPLPFPSVQVLASFLVQQGPNAEVAELAGHLLSGLLAEFPALQYKRDVLAALFTAAHEEDEQQV